MVFIPPCVGLTKGMEMLKDGERHQKEVEIALKEWEKRLEEREQRIVEQEARSIARDQRLNEKEARLSELEGKRQATANSRQADKVGGRGKEKEKVRKVATLSRSSYSTSSSPHYAIKTAECSASIAQAIARKKARCTSAKPTSRKESTEVGKGKNKKEEANKKKKGNANEKNPNLPKRAMSSFLLFYKENRARLAEPGLSHLEVTRLAGIEWNALKDKSKWNDLAAEDQKRYTREMAAYKLKKKSQKV